MTASAAEPADDLSEPGYRDGRTGHCSTPSVVPGAALPWNSNGRVGGFLLINIVNIVDIEDTVILKLYLIFIVHTGGVSIKWGFPHNRYFLSWKVPTKKWMRTGGVKRPQPWRSSFILWFIQKNGGFHGGFHQWGYGGFNGGPMVDGFLVIHILTWDGFQLGKWG